MTTRRYGHLVAIDGGRALTSRTDRRSDARSDAGGSVAAALADVPLDAVARRVEPPLARVMLAVASAAVCLL
ncbi:MAG: hypothetical protein M3Y87_36640, partial [Myxococcota bacterium]|nr:hypothetical protein [Myxococcota bacterium]